MEKSFFFTIAEVYGNDANGIANRVDPELTQLL